MLFLLVESTNASWQETLERYQRENGLPPFPIENEQVIKRLEDKRMEYENINSEGFFSSRRG